MSHIGIYIWDVNEQWELIHTILILALVFQLFDANAFVLLFKYMNSALSLVREFAYIDIKEKHGNTFSHHW